MDMDHAMILSIYWLVVGIVSILFFVVFKRRLALRHLNNRDDYTIKKKR